MTIPCTNPRTSSEPSLGVEGLVDFVCQVPGCDWAIRTVKSAQEPSWHRQEHRDAVPTTWVQRTEEWDVHCTPCGGHRRTFGSRREAETWRREHLAVEHGLAVCA